jgi:hypothetical protein
MKKNNILRNKRQKLINTLKQIKRKKNLVSRQKQSLDRQEMNEEIEKRNKLSERARMEHIKQSEK